MTEAMRARQAAARERVRTHLREVPAFRALLRSIEHGLLESAGPLARPVLDLGCGDGHFAGRALADEDAVGTDLDHRALREARERGAHRHLVAARAGLLPFPDASFATIVANCVLEHIPDLASALSEAARVLRPGGRLIFGAPTRRFGVMLLTPAVLRGLRLERVAQRYERWFNRRSQHQWTLSPEEWTGALYRCGFEIDWCQGYMTPRAHHVFELLHYAGAGALVARQLTGKWVPWRDPVSSAVLTRWLGALASIERVDGAPFAFFVARRV